MNRFFLLLSALFLTLSTQLFAADEETQNTEVGTSVVANALAQVNFLKGKPDPNAKYYIYLHSAGWCGVCRSEMPNIVNSYKKLKEQGIEIILFGLEETESDVVAYAERFNVEFPVLKESPELASQVPGYKIADMIPHIIVVDRNGKVVVETHPTPFFQNDQWKSYFPALSLVHYLKGEPDPDAKYYIYLHSASRSRPCCKGMPRIVNSYKKLKEQGFEIILFGHDGTDKEVVAFAKRFKVEFPVLKDSPELASKVPGYKKITRLPRIIVVDRSGKVIVETHPVRFFRNDQWKNCISKKECVPGKAPSASLPK